MTPGTTVRRHDDAASPRLCRSVAVEVTGRCNQHCAYCYNRWRGAPDALPPDLDTASLLDLLDRVVDQARPAHVTLTGGEPFSRPDLDEVVAHVNGRGAPVVIISNGGLVDAAVVRWLARRRVLCVQVTLGGPDAPTHDALCGPGSHARAVAAVRRLTEGGIPVVGSILCTRANAGQCGAVAALFSDLGVRTLAFNRLNPSGHARSAVSTLLPTRTAVLTALTAVEQVAAARALRVTSTMPLPPCAVDTGAFPHVRFGQCSAGTPVGELAVGPDGAVRLCLLQPHAIGTLREAPLETLLAAGHGARFRSQIPEFCRPCPRAPTCLGGCGAAAAWAFGSPAALDPFLAQHVDPDWQRRLVRDSGDGLS